MTPSVWFGGEALRLVTVGVGVDSELHTELGEGLYMAVSRY
jgi:hypothetical protein